MLRGPGKPLLLLLMPLIVCSCGILSREPYAQPRFYDLGQPQQLPNEGLNVMVSQFTSSGPYRTKMVYRRDDCRLETDEYNRWIQPPAIMLTRYFQTAFSLNNTSSKPAIKLEAELLDFDINLDQKQATLTVEYSLYRQSDNELLTKQTVTNKESLSSLNPTAFAVAMSTLSRQLLTSINSTLLTLQLQPNGDKHHDQQRPAGTRRIIQ